MNHNPDQLNETSYRTAKATLRSYVIGFTISLILTLNAYILIVTGAYADSTLLAAIIALALAQFVVQLSFFLHLGRAGSRWNKVVFLAMLLVVAILAGGSLWIMSNLNYHMMPDEMNIHMLEKSGVEK